LRGGALNLIETVGQSLALVAPTLTPALNVSVVAGLAGIGCAMAYLIGAFGVVIVAASIGVLASRHPEAGSYFVYIGRNFGPYAGALAGWAMISAYLSTAIAASLSFAIFLGDFFAAFSVHATMPALLAALLGFIAAITYAAYRDVKFSSRMGLIMEAVALSIIIGITALIIRAKGTLIDPAQLHLFSLKYGAVLSALPFVIYCFVGFESAATLAKESANPRRNIPLAVMGCAAFAGVFFTLIAYFMVFGIDDDAAALGRSAAPFGEVASRAGLHWASVVVYFSALISVFACSLACINAAARLLFSMGRYRFLHASLGRVHATHHTPHVAVLLCGTLVAAIALSLLPLGFLAGYGYMGTFASFGFVVVYLALCVVAPIDLRSTGEMKASHLASGVAGAALMVFVLIGSVYPAPPHPYDVLPYLFLGYMALGGVWFAILKRQAPQTLIAIQHDMEG